MNVNKAARMRIEQSPLSSVDPILFRSATARTAGTDIPGAYDPHLQVWVVRDAGELRPIIETVDEALLETHTVTKVRQEADDQDISACDLEGSPARCNLVELVTKTEVQQESDDQIDPGFLLDTENTSQAARAQGRIQLTHTLLELETKTSADVEHDDQGPIL